MSLAIDNHRLLNGEMDSPLWSECSELHCTSTSAFGELAPGVDLPWCWANLNASENDYSCSDGYIGVGLQSVDLMIIPDSGTFQYYTCCPTGEDSAAGNSSSFLNNENTTIFLPPEVLPRCSPSRENCNDYYNDCIADGISEPISCKDDENGLYVYPYRTENQPHLVFQSWSYSYYRCCSTPHEEASTISLPESFRFGLGILGSFLTLSLVCAILFDRTVRRQPFNLYIMFLTISDFILNFVTTLVSGWPIFLKETFPSACLIHFFPSTFYALVNYWLNILVVAEIHRLLKDSKARRRSFPPSIKKVVIQSITVYMLAGLVCVLWMYIHCIKVPEPAEKLEYASTLEYQILYLLVVLLNGVLPFLYLLKVLMNIRRTELIPKNGRLRVLLFYFSRIIIVFMVGTLLIMPLMVMTPLNVVPGGAYISRCLLSVLTTISALVAMQKPDIKIAVFQLWTCKWGTSPEDSDGGSSGFWSSMLLLTKSKSSSGRKDATNAELKEGGTGSSSANSSSSPEMTQEDEKKRFEIFDTMYWRRRWNRNHRTNPSESMEGDDSEEIIFDSEIAPDHESKKEEISLFFDNLPKESIWNQMDEWGNGVVDEVQEHESLSKPEDDEEKKQATDINDDIDC